MEPTTAAREWLSPPALASALMLEGWIMVTQHPVGEAFLELVQTEPAWKDCARMGPVQVSGVWVYQPSYYGGLGVTWIRTGWPEIPIRALLDAVVAIAVWRHHLRREAVDGWSHFRQQNFYRRTCRDVLVEVVKQGRYADRVAQQAACDVRRVMARLTAASLEREG